MNCPEDEAAVHDTTYSAQKMKLLAQYVKSIVQNWTGRLVGDTHNFVDDNHSSEDESRCFVGGG
jgi:hypothetical protein